MITESDWHVWWGSELRDAISGNMLASYTLSGVNRNSLTVANVVLLRNLTIALMG
jgi:hypothetical protein